MLRSSGRQTISSKSILDPPRSTFSLFGTVSWFPEVTNTSISTIWETGDRKGTHLVSTSRKDRILHPYVTKLTATDERNCTISRIKKVRHCWGRQISTTLPPWRDRTPTKESINPQPRTQPKSDKLTRIKKNPELGLILQCEHVSRVTSKGGL